MHGADTPGTDGSAPDGVGGAGDRSWLPPLLLGAVIIAAGLGVALWQWWPDLAWEAGLVRPVNPYGAGLAGTGARTGGSDSSSAASSSARVSSLSFSSSWTT